MAAALSFQGLLGYAEQRIQAAESRLVNAVAQKLYALPTWADVSFPARPARQTPRYVGLSTALDLPITFSGSAAPLAADFGFWKLREGAH